MKKAVQIILIAVLVLALAAGGIITWGWVSAGMQDVPIQQLQVGDAQVAPSGFTWHLPVAFGLLHKEVAVSTHAQANFDVIEQTTLPITFPAGFSASATLQKEGTEVWRGTGEDWAAFALPEDGDYHLNIELQKPAEARDSQGYGSYFYNLVFTLQQPKPADPLQPEAASATPSATGVAQGDVLAIEVLHPDADVAPTVSAPEGLTATAFLKAGPYRWLAYLPTSFYTEPGEYTALVTAGEEQWEVPFSVAPTEFERQDMEIDLSDPAISAAVSDEADVQFAGAIPPLFLQADEEKYWNGAFIWPCEAWISTEYGSRRFTNGEPSSRHHGGMDIAANTGTPVVAPAPGRVVFADFLLSTGHTVVLEHGGGFKSIYYHLEATSAEVGAMVDTGDEIGLVGSTGYSTGPHLHFELRVGEVAVSPSLLLNGEGGLVALDLAEEAPADAA